MINVKELCLIDILPDSIKSDQRIKNISEILDRELASINKSIEKLLIIPNVDNLESDLLDELAYAFHVDFYKNDLSIEKKRELVKESLFIHMKKGTPGAVEDLIKKIFGNGKVIEWFEYGGIPHRFKVKTSNREAVDQKALEFLEAINSVKRLSSKLEEVVISQSTFGNLIVAGTLSVMDKNRMLTKYP